MDDEIIRRLLLKTGMLWRRHCKERLTITESRAKKRKEKEDILHSDEYTKELMKWYRKNNGTEVLLSNFTGIPRIYIRTLQTQEVHQKCQFEEKYTENIQMSNYEWGIV